MPYSASTGIYTPASGATTAAAGQIIASATWNSIHTDFSNALTALGPANLPFINGGQNGYYFTKVQTANFGSAASDIATFAIASILPPTITNYRVEALRIGNATGTLAGVTVTIYTAASAGGSNVIASTATTVTSSLPGGANSYQIIGGPATVMYNNATLFLHISTSVATANSANVSLAIAPVY